jgi:hypothetical protein
LLAADAAGLDGPFGGIVRSLTVGVAVLPGGSIEAEPRLFGDKAGMA